MASSAEIIKHLVDEGNVACAHFQIWWALRNLALPDYYDTMNDQDYVQFFHASNSGHYKLIFVALGKIYDSDTHSAGIPELKNALRAEGHPTVADKLEADLSDVTKKVKRVLTIRNRTLLHNEQAISREKVYKLDGGITPNQLRHLINTTSSAINIVADAINYKLIIATGDSYEKATMAMLDKLRKNSR
jgi:AbiU2